MTTHFTENLKTNIREIDEQHQELFDKVNTLFEACNQGKGKDEISKIMKYLEEYATLHFNTEEQYMEKFSYPDYLAHKSAHLQFVRIFSDLKYKHSEKGANIQIIIQTNRILTEWLITHLKNEDRELANFLRSKLK